MSCVKTFSFFKVKPCNFMSWSKKPFFTSNKSGYNLVKCRGVVFIIISYDFNMPGALTKHSQYIYNSAHTLLTHMARQASTSD